MVLKTVTFGVSPVAISLFYPEFISMCCGVPVHKDLLKFSSSCSRRSRPARSSASPAGERLQNRHFLKDIGLKGYAVERHFWHFLKNSRFSLIILVS